MIELNAEFIDNWEEWDRFDHPSYRPFPNEESAGYYGEFTDFQIVLSAGDPLFILQP